MDLFVKKPLEKILLQADEKQVGLHKTLTAFSLVMLGIGAIIGAGLFIRTAAAAADSAGPSVTISFIIAAIGSALAGLCYAEFATRLPIAGSAYTYTYATMGELIAWIIGWDLVLEYALGAATVAIAWSQYLNKLLGYIEINGHPLSIPYEWCHSPLMSNVDSTGVMHHGIMNIPAFFIVCLITCLLIRGIKRSAFVNNILVIIKISIVLLFVGFGWQFINPDNLTPYIPAPTLYVDPQGIEYNYGGIRGIIGAAGVVFFAFIGFDSISTAAQETINPKKNLPIGILGSLLICTVLYISFSYVLTGVASTEDFRHAGMEASVTFAIQNYMPGYNWLAKLITVAILIGLTSVILVFLIAQSRIFYSISRDGLIPKLFSDVHPIYRTPYKSNIALMVFVGTIAAFTPADLAGEMTSIGTLFAFVLVCAGVIVLRRNYKPLPNEFKTPFVPLVPILGILVCSTMIYGLGYLNWMRLVIWMVIGLIIYFCYGRTHSEMNQTNNR